MKDKKSLGNLGEGFAKGYLTRQGYRIVHAPFRCKIGEIDIIALDNDILVFLEVKTRRSNRFGSPLESVTPKKQRQIIKVAQFFLAYTRKPAFKLCRFDVLGIVQEPGHSEPKIIHAKDAFRQDYGL